MAEIHERDPFESMAFGVMELAGAELTPADLDLMRRMHEQLAPLVAALDALDVAANPAEVDLDPSRPPSGR
jgi:hypothetical protein